MVCEWGTQADHQQKHFEQSIICSVLSRAQHTLSAAKIVKII